MAVTTAPNNGALRVTISAQDGANARLHGLRIARLDNAQVEGLPGQGTLIAPTTVTLPEWPQELAFTVRRVNAGQGATVQLVAVDSCGEWPTFVGGGASAF